MLEAPSAYGSEFKRKKSESFHCTRGRFGCNASLCDWNCRLSGECCDAFGLAVQLQKTCQYPNCGAGSGGDTTIIITATNIIVSKGSKVTDGRMLNFLTKLLKAVSLLSTPSGVLIIIIITIAAIHLQADLKFKCLQDLLSCASRCNCHQHRHVEQESSVMFLLVLTSM